MVKKPRTRLPSKERKKEIMDVYLRSRARVSVIAEGEIDTVMMNEIVMDIAESIEKIGVDPCLAVEELSSMNGLRGINRLSMGRWLKLDRYVNERPFENDHRLVSEVKSQLEQACATVSKFTSALLRAFCVRQEESDK